MTSFKNTLLKDEDFLHMSAKFQIDNLCVAKYIEDIEEQKPGMNRVKRIA